MTTIFTVELDRSAEDDLRSLHAYVAQRQSPGEADALLARLLDRVGTLEHYPLRGSVPNELEVLGTAEYRQVVLPPYRMIYYIVGSRVIIAIIADGRRDMAALLERRLLAH